MSSNYWTSTQCNDWLLSRQQVALARAEDLEYADSPEELFAIRIWLTNCISSLTKRLSLRQRITATAIVFFHRFYACSPGNSFSSTDPSLVATACVYVASKVEENPVHIRSVVQEAMKLWAELGHWKFTNDIASLAEMEFYLLEDLQFHLIVYHPYRSLITIAGAVGKGADSQLAGSNKSTTASSWSKMLASPAFMSTASMAAKDEEQTTFAGIPIGADVFLPGPADVDIAFDSPGGGLAGRSEDAQSGMKGPERDRTRQQEQRRAMEDVIAERHRMLLFSGDDEMPLAQLDELDEQVLQMAWFVLNDTYRTDLLLLYPPHLIAVASIFLALVLHDPSREKLLKSKTWMQDRRDKFEQAIKATPQTANDMQAKDASASEGDARRSTGVTSVKPQQQQSGPAMPSAAGGATVRPLRGLASLPPRPTHLPPRPGGTPQQQQQPASVQSNPGTPVGTPKLSDTHGSPAAEGSTPKSGVTIPSMSEEKPKTRPSSHATLPVPPPDAMTFLAALNVDLNAVGEIVQEMIGLYQFWSRQGGGEVGEQDEEAINLNDGAGMFRRLERMREMRRNDLLQNGPGW